MIKDLRAKVDQLESIIATAEKEGVPPNQGSNSIVSNPNSMNTTIHPSSGVSNTSIGGGDVAHMSAAELRNR